MAGHRQRLAVQDTWSKKKVQGSGCMVQGIWYRIYGKKKTGYMVKPEPARPSAGGSSRAACSSGYTVRRKNIIFKEKIYGCMVQRIYGKARTCSAFCWRVILSDSCFRIYGSKKGYMDIWFKGYMVKQEPAQPSAGGSSCATHASGYMVRRKNIWFEERIYGYMVQRIYGKNRTCSAFC